MTEEGQIQQYSFVLVGSGICKKCEMNYIATVLPYIHMYLVVFFNFQLVVKHSIVIWVGKLKFVVRQLELERLRTFVNEKKFSVLISTKQFCRIGPISHV
jgi:hypothetical protein